uniref:uncharacterized protein LOC118524023 isoform X1 n=1 Tax=Halichoerus grypus TaxID=9711 RepID=UPI0016596E02|nr:uncharacterized protein LOC118524023 isoform X1 [Halichoerus grypus]
MQSLWETRRSAGSVAQTRRPAPAALPAPRLLSDAAATPGRTHRWFWKRLSRPAHSPGRQTLRGCSRRKHRGNVAQSRKSSGLDEGGPRLVRQGLLGNVAQSRKSSGLDEGGPRLVRQGLLGNVAQSRKSSGMNERDSGHRSRGIWATSRRGLKAAGRTREALSSGAWDLGNVQKSCWTHKEVGFTGKRKAWERREVTWVSGLQSSSNLFNNPASFLLPPFLTVNIFQHREVERRAQCMLKGRMQHPNYTPLHVDCFG